jgi:hypothetical protein
MRLPRITYQLDVHYGAIKLVKRGMRLPAMLISSEPLNPSFFQRPGVSSWPRGISTSCWIRVS